MGSILDDIMERAEKMISAFRGGLRPPIVMPEQQYSDFYELAREVKALKYEVAALRDELCSVNAWVGFK